MTAIKNITARLKLTAAPGATKSLHLPKLREFLMGLDPQQRKWFFNDFPKLLDSWLSGGMLGKRKSDVLNIEAAPYKGVDGMAVALFKLRDVYPISIPSTIYRFQASRTKVSKPVKKEFSNRDFLKPLNSWTAKKVDPRKGLHTKEKNPVRLAWKVNPKWVCATSHSLLMLAQDASFLQTRGGNFVNRNMAWVDAKAEIFKYRTEQEVLVYLPRGQTMTCLVEPA